MTPAFGVGLAVTGLTERFRKRARSTLANRIDHLAIDVIEDLVEARYTRDKLQWLRMLLRRSYVVEQRAALEAAASEMVRTWRTAIASQSILILGKMASRSTNANMIRRRLITTLERYLRQF